MDRRPLTKIAVSATRQNPTALEDVDKTPCVVAWKLWLSARLYTKKDDDLHEHRECKYRWRVNSHDKWYRVNDDDSCTWVDVWNDGNTKILLDVKLRNDCDWVGPVEIDPAKVDVYGGKTWFYYHVPEEDKG